MLDQDASTRSTAISSGQKNLRKSRLFVGEMMTEFGRLERGEV